MLPSFDVYTAPLYGTSLIEASAGTGKTWNICGVYIRLLLERQLPVRNILVVTFTKSATAELKERIRERILNLERVISAGTAATTTSESFEAHYLSLCVGTVVQRTAAMALLRRAISEFDEAAIFTIHGYCQRALSELPFAAGLAFNVETLEDDSAYIRRVAADFFRQRIQSGELDLDTLYQLRPSVLPECLERYLRQRLGKPLARMEFNARGRLEDFHRYVGVYREAGELWRAEKQTIVDTLLEGLGALKGTQYRDNWVRGSVPVWEDFFSLSFARFLDKKPWRDKCKYLRSGYMQECANGKCALPEHRFFSLAESLYILSPAAQAGLAAKRIELLQSFLTEAPDRVRKAKRTLRIVAFDDMLYNFYRALYDPALPWLAEKMRERYPVALVDEFQDTDPLQLAIFKKIYPDDEAAHCLVAVGDPKQAIYRFRNADLHAYLALLPSVENRRWSLATSQRSVPGLITALNALFSQHTDVFFYKELQFQALAAGPRSLQRTALVDQDGLPAPMQIWWLPLSQAGEMLNKTQAEAWATNASVAEIQRLLRSARIGTAALRPGQIAVLVRTNRQGRMMRVALASAGIAAIERSQASVYATEEAETMAYLLAALNDPVRERSLATVLASPLFGLTANAIAADLQDTGRLAEWAMRFSQYRQLCLKHGFARMWRQLNQDGGLAARLLAQTDGTRRLTNYVHLAELLQGEWDKSTSFAVLQRTFLDAMAAADDKREESQLRLESDEDHVQIVTIHASKGLEYEVVLCPYLWSTRLANERDFGEYHDQTGQNVLAYGELSEAAKNAEQHEVFAEDLRLIYVALTRAVQRVYFAAGLVAIKKDKGQLSCRSPLNWLIAGSSQDPKQWMFGDALPCSTIEAQWRSWADAHGDYVSLGEPMAQLGNAVPVSVVASEPFRAEHCERHLAWTWRSASFTSLNAEAVMGKVQSGETVKDHDQSVTPDWENDDDTVEPVLAHEMLSFPRGRNAGVLVHAVFEQADFTREDTWPTAIARALNHHRLEDRTAREGEGPTEAQLQTMLLAGLREVSTCPLDGRDLCLANIPMPDRLNELSFCLPASAVQTEQLYKVLRDAGLRFPQGDSGFLQGYLRGSLDCVFRHRGRYYLIDWKSNYLGHTASDYSGEALAEVMAEEGYTLQYALYTLALHRYLRARLAQYDYERDFGGCYYLFVRGIRKAWQISKRPLGLFTDRLHAETVMALDALFAGKSL